MILKDTLFKIRNIFQGNYRDFKQFNSVEKAYFYAQLLWLVAIVILMTLTPLLVKAITGETALTGVLRAVYMWSMMGTLLFAGEIIKRFSTHKVLLTTSIVRSILFIGLTWLLFQQAVTFEVLIIFFVLNAIITAHSHLLDIDMGGTNRIFSTADKKAKALYLFRFFDYLCLLILPVSLGFFIDFLDKYIGTYNALGVAFTFFCAAMVGSALIYMKYLRRHKKKSIDIIQKKKGALFHGLILETPKRLMRTLKLVWHYPSLRLRFTMVCMEGFIDDALLIVILPTFALDILHAGASGNGLLIGAMNAGGLLATVMLLSNANRLQKKYGFYRYILGLALLSCLAFIPTIFLWMYPSLLVAIGAVILIKFLYDPLRCRMDSLLQIEINSNTEVKPEEGNIFSLLSFLSTFSAGLGSLGFAFIFMHSSPGTLLYSLVGINAPMKMVSILFFIFCVMNILGIIWFKRHVYHTYSLGYITEKENLEQFKKNLEKMYIFKCQEETFYTEIASNRPTVALLAPPTLDNIAILRQGGELSAGDFHLVLDANWIFQELQYDGTNRLYLKKGIYFDREGDPILAEYKTPRLIHYYDNFYIAADAKNKETVFLERNLDTPMGCDSRLENLINENLLTRVWLSKHHIPSLKTLAFLMPGHTLVTEIDNKEESPFITVLGYPHDCVDEHTIIHEKVMLFLKSYSGNEVVIKPSGAGFIPPYGVRFFKVTEVSQIVDYVMELESDSLMTKQGAILIEERIYPPILFLRFNETDQSGRYCILNEENIPLHILTKDEITQAKETDKKEWVIHVLAVRTPWNQCAVSGLIVRVGQYGAPLSTSAAIVPFESMIATLRIQYNVLKTDEEVFLFEKKIEQLATEILFPLEAEIEKCPRKPDCALQAQIDYFGFDLILKIMDGQLDYTIIAIHDHNVGKQYEFDVVYPDRLGMHSDVWLATMLSRARQSACRAKRLIMVNAGYEMKKFFFERAEELNIHIILIDNADTWAKEWVPEFIAVDMDNPALALQQALQGLRHSVAAFGPIDGITTFWDYGVVFTAELARELKLPFLSVANARTTKNKLKTRKMLSKSGLSAPRFFYIEDENTLDIMLRKITTISHGMKGSVFPMIMKPIAGAASVYTKKVNNPQEIRDFYMQLKEMVNIKGGLMGPFNHEGRFIVEEFIAGKEFDVDIAIQEGRIKYVSITDNWSEDPLENINPVRDSLPCARLSNQEQQSSINLAILALQSLGITDGIMHIEGKYDAQKNGAEILEINTRPAGEYLTPWQKKVWGVDLPELLFSIALQIPIYVYKSPTPLMYLESYCFNADCSGIFQKWSGIQELDQCPGFEQFFSFVKEGEEVIMQEGKVDQVGYVVAKGATKKQALENLNNILPKIKFTISPTTSHFFPK